MRRVLSISAVILCGLMGTRFVFAVDVSSSNFKNSGSSFAPAKFSQSSPSFQVTASVEEAAVKGSSPSFTVQSGVPLSSGAAPAPATPAAPPVSGGGGGGGFYGGALGFAPTTTAEKPDMRVPPPTLAYRSPTFQSHQLLGGSYDPTASVIVVNGSTDGVQLLPENRWQRDLPLFFGRNVLQIHSQDAAGNRSILIGGEIERRLIGDVNNNRVVDDVDLSLFTRAWKTYSLAADFTEDERINQNDLSLLVGQWGRTW